MKIKILHTFCCILEWDRAKGNFYIFLAILWDFFFLENLFSLSFCSPNDDYLSGSDHEPTFYQSFTALAMISFPFLFPQFLNTVFLFDCLN